MDCNTDFFVVCCKFVRVELEKIVHGGESQLVSANDVTKHTSTSYDQTILKEGRDCKGTKSRSVEVECKH